MRRSIQIIYHQKQEECGNLCVPLKMTGTRNSSSCRIRCCTIDCSKGLSDQAALPKWARRSSRQQLPAPCHCLSHACSPQMWLHPACLLLWPSCCPWAQCKDVPFSSQRSLLPLPQSASLCCRQKGKNFSAWNDAGFLWTLCLHLRVLLRCSEPSGHAQVPHLKCRSSLRQTEGWIWH